MGKLPIPLSRPLGTGMLVGAAVGIALATTASMQTAVAPNASSLMMWSLLVQWRIDQERKLGPACLDACIPRRHDAPRQMICGCLRCTVEIGKLQDDVIDASRQGIADIGVNVTGEQAQPDGRSGISDLS